MHSAAYQIILITVYAFIAINDSLISNTLTQPAIAGMISGMIMGDLKTGLMVGGTLQLVVHPSQIILPAQYWERRLP